MVSPVKRTLFHTFKQILWHPVAGLGAFLLAVIGYGIFVRDEFLPEKYAPWRIGKLLRLIPPRWWGAVVFTTVVVILFLALWRTHKLLSEQESQVAKQITDLGQELNDWRTRKPSILVTVHRIIQHRHRAGLEIRRINSGSFDLFVEVTLTLEEPRQVSISQYSCEVHLPTGARRLGKLIRDLPKWSRFREVGTGSYRMFSLEALPPELTQRGQAVHGWLHVQVERNELEIAGARCVVNVVTPHGTASGSDVIPWADPDDIVIEEEINQESPA